MQLLLLALFATAALGAHNYDHLELVRLSLKSEADQQTFADLVTTHNIDVWRGPTRTGADVMVTANVLQELSEAGLVEKTLIKGPELTTLAHNQISRADHETNMTWTSYHTFDEINDYLDHEASEHPEFASVDVLATSWEGREIKIFTMSTDTRPDSPIILVDAGIHAREWISPAVATYFLDSIIHDEELLSQATYVFIPILNVDGYQYAWDEDRLWRKTRSKRESEACYGTDANRNFDFHWMEIGASEISCTETYAGIEAASENLTQGLTQYMLDNADRIKAYITLHSYGQLMLAPYGYTDVPPTNMDELNRVAGDAANAIEAVYGTTYTYGSASQVLYYNSGTSRDYAAGVIGAPYVYTIELRDEGDYGFLLPEDQIMDTCVETFEGFKVIVQAVIDISS